MSKKHIFVLALPKSEISRVQQIFEQCCSNSNNNNEEKEREENVVDEERTNVESEPTISFVGFQRLLSELKVSKRFVKVSHPLPCGVQDWRQDVFEHISISHSSQDSNNNEGRGVTLSALLKWYESYYTEKQNHSVSSGSDTEALTDTTTTTTTTPQLPPVRKTSARHLHSHQPPPLQFNTTSTSQTNSVLVAPGTSLSKLQVVTSPTDAPPNQPQPKQQLPPVTTTKNITPTTTTANAVSPSGKTSLAAFKFAAHSASVEATPSIIPSNSFLSQGSGGGGSSNNVTAQRATSPISPSSSSSGRLHPTSLLLPIHKEDGAVVGKVRDVAIPTRIEMSCFFDFAASTNPSWSRVRNKGIEAFAMEMLRQAREDKDASLRDIIRGVGGLPAYQATCEVPESHKSTSRAGIVASESDTASNATGAETDSNGRNNVTLEGDMMRKGSPTAFTSALTLHHLATGAGALWQLQAAVIFVDISGYSAVSHMLGDRGPHVFASIVNAYLKIIVDEVREYGGDVVKFAGDALMAMWYSDRPQINTRAAVSCALSLLEKPECTSYPVPDTDLSFGLHVGVSAGTVISHIFAPRATNADKTTPTHFHFLTGEPIPEVSIACGLAARGQLVLSEHAVRCFGSADEFFTYKDRSGKELQDTLEPIVNEDHPTKFYLHKTAVDGGRGLRKDVRVPVPVKQSKGGNANMYLSAQVPHHHQHRGSGSRQLAMLVMPPPIVSRVSAGINPFYLAEMRDLVVLFVKLSKSSSVAGDVWFDEVFSVLTRESCSVVQILDDDKGVHIVAAFNLYVMHDDSADKCIEVASILRSKRSDCHVGAASGAVLCGVLGSREACQWDITGPACVRACRLMQHAAQKGFDVIFDDSIYNEAADRAQLVRQDPINVKGSNRPVPIFTLRRSGVSGTAPQGEGGEYKQVSLAASTTGRSSLVLEEAPALYFPRLCSDVHSDVVTEIENWILGRQTSLSLELLKKRSVRYSTSNSLRQQSSREDEVTTSVTNEPSFSDVASVLTPSTATTVQGAPQSGFGGDTPINNKDVPMTTVIIAGAPGTGKFSLCLNALKNTGLVPVVHTAGHDRAHVQLDLLNTLVRWFRAHSNEGIRKKAQKVWNALHSIQYHVAFKLGLDLVAHALHVGFKCAILVRRGQFLDRHSAVFVRTLTERFASNRHIFLFVTCSPLYHNRRPHEVFLARFGMSVMQIEEATADEIRSLATFLLGGTCSMQLLDLIVRRSSRFVECAVELVRHITSTGIVVHRHGEITLPSRRLHDLEEVPWDVISPAVVKKKCIHQMDHMPPFLQTTAKIICAITEQPDITAFFHSVNRVCERMLGQKLRVHDIEQLSELFILRMCEHRCTSHTGSGELDAATFYVPAMRDILQSTLVPSQRVQINLICAEAYAETHPMDHPMQYLVRARHELFANNTDNFSEDMKRGWALICDMFGYHEADGGTQRSELQNTYVHWLMKSPQWYKSGFKSHPKFMELENANEAMRILKMLDRNMMSMKRGTSFTLADGSLIHELTWINQTRDPKLIPLSLGPCCELLRRILRRLSELNEVTELILEGGLSGIGSPGLQRHGSFHTPNSTPATTPQNSSQLRTMGSSKRGGGGVNVSRRVSLAMGASQAMEESVTLASSPPDILCMDTLRAIYKDLKLYIEFLKMLPETAVVIVSNKSNNNNNNDNSTQDSSYSNAAEIVHVLGHDDDNSILSDLEDELLNKVFATQILNRETSTIMALNAARGNLPPGADLSDIDADVVTAATTTMVAVNKALRKHVLQEVPNLLVASMESLDIEDGLAIVRVLMEQNKESCDSVVTALKELALQDLLGFLSENSYRSAISAVTILYERMTTIRRRVLCLIADDAVGRDVLNDSLFDALRVMYDGLHLPVAEQHEVRRDFVLFLAFWLGIVLRKVTQGGSNVVRV
eukprot:PhM_4_TR10456/c2_g2_i1/m.85137